MHNSFQIQKQVVQRRQLSNVFCIKTRSNGYELKQWMFRLDTRKIFLLWGWLSTRTDYLERLWKHHHWKFLREGKTDIHLGCFR